MITNSSKLGVSVSALNEQITMKSTTTVPQFCDGHNISRTHFYELIKQGRAPRLMKVGRRTLISLEAAIDWRRRMELETATSSASFDGFLHKPISA